MITQLVIENFKCFKNATEFNLNKINLLTGINGRGKSSLLQSLLVFFQTGEKYINWNQLALNGCMIDLGSFQDIKNNEVSIQKSINFKFQINNAEDVVLEYSEDENNPFQARLTDSNPKDLDHNHVIFDELDSIHYVSADRLGPVKYVEKVDVSYCSKVGKRGEFSLNVLDYYKDKRVEDELYLGNDAQTLLQQTQEWLSYILDDTKINLTGTGSESSVLSLLISNKSSSHFHKALNVGFGYSYILPIIITGLIAEQGEIVIIENPEAHLHPRAQSKLIEFLAKVSSCGTQVFIESHSEHILNGLRLCSLREDIAINHDDISIIYFDNDFSIQNLQLNHQAKLSHWPTGFFDQQEKDLARLLKASMVKR